ncbi:MAG: N-acetyltransferase family protein [Actinomycetes bacterium]
MTVEAGADAYPADLERVAVLADHREVFIRPVRPSDAAELRRAIATADTDTLYARFLGAPPHEEASIRRLVEVDYRHRLALVAFAPDGTGVGIARYEGEVGSDTAEVAVVVDPGWRRVGLGSLLLRELGAAAVSRGIRRFTALALADNYSVLALLRAAGLAFSVEIHSGTSKILVLLQAQAPPPTGDLPND